MQQRLLFIKQNPINFREIHVPRTNLNCRKTFAVIEGFLPDAGEFTVFLEGDVSQAAATFEGPFLDTGNAVRDGDAHQAAAVMEGHNPDAGDTIRDRDARQAGAV